MIEIINSKEKGLEGIFKKLTKRNHGEVTDVINSVESILSNVRKSGDKALIEYTRSFDKVDLDLDKIMVTSKEIDEAFQNLDKKLIGVIEKAKNNIERFHSKQKDNSWFSNEENGVILGQMYTALEIVGVYVPGGTAPLPSSVLMNVVPAKVAGVDKIIMCTPPNKEGKVNSTILAAAKVAGVDEVYKVGGAQAIAAMAFGTKTIKKVDKVVGPGNIYVATAKKMVYGYCDIDMIAGPSEVMIVADEKASPRYLAADLLSQAEHDVLASSILVTTSEKLANQTKKEIAKQLAKLNRKEIAAKSIQDYSAIMIVDTLEEAIGLVNKVAPEHLELCIEEPFNILSSVRNAGAIFMGNYSPEPLGDYFAGPNHVLPTSGTARFFSPLNVGDFVKKTSLISYTRKALETVKDDVVLFAEAEGLDAHANAIRVRFEEKEG